MKKKELFRTLSMIFGVVMTSVGGYLIGRYHGKHDVMDRIADEIDDENIIFEGEINDEQLD